MLRHVIDHEPEGPLEFGPRGRPLVLLEETELGERRPRESEGAEAIRVCDLGLESTERLGLQAVRDDGQEAQQAEHRGERHVMTHEILEERLGLGGARAA